MYKSKSIQDRILLIQMEVVLERKENIFFSFKITVEFVSSLLCCGHSYKKRHVKQHNTHLMRIKWFIVSLL